MKLVELLLIGLVVITGLGQLGRVSLGEGVFFYPNDVIIPLIISGWLLYRLVVTKKLYLPRLTLLISIFLIWAVAGLIGASVILDRTSLVSSTLYLIRLMLYIGLYPVAYDLVKHGSSKRLLMSLAGVSGLVSLLGFAQLLIIPDFSELAAKEGWDPHFYRLLSTFFDPNFVAGFLALGLALSLAGYLKYKDQKIFFGAAAILDVVAIVLTFSRSGYAAAAVVLGLMTILRWRKLLLLIPVVVVAAAIILPRTIDRLTEGIDPGSSGYARVESWQNSLTIARDNLFLGVGYNAYRFAQERYNFVKSDQTNTSSKAATDSSLLLILTTTGLIGLGLFLVILLGMMYLSWRSFKKGSAWGLALLISLPALLVHSFFVNSLFYIWIMLYLWIMVGAVDAEAD
jgi:O-antigen ligase